MARVLNEPPPFAAKVVDTRGKLKIWVFISEIFPNNVRASGQSWGTGIHWIFAALITLIT